MTTMNEVRKLLKNKGIKQPARATKVELVRLLQRSEDNFDCFATAVDGVCDQMSCVWREDCFKAAKA
jgi:hypothetical protein